MHLYYSYIKRLNLGNRWNYPIIKDNLPQNLTHLTIGFDFDQKFNEDSFPDSIQYIDLLSSNISYKNFMSFFDGIKNLTNIKYIGFTGYLPIGSLPISVEIIGIKKLVCEQYNISFAVKYIFIENYFEDYNKIKLPFGTKIIKQKYEW